MAETTKLSFDDLRLGQILSDLSGTYLWEVVALTPSTFSVRYKGSVPPSSTQDPSLYSYEPSKLKWFQFYAAPDDDPNGRPY